MNKKYMDFTPVKSNTASGKTSGNGSVRVASVRTVSSVRTTTTRPAASVRTVSAARSTAQVRPTTSTRTTQMRSTAVRPATMRTGVQSGSVSRMRSSTQAGSTNQVRTRTASQARPTQTRVRTTAVGSVTTRQGATRPTASRTIKASPRASMQRPKLGEVEDLGAKFVMTDVPKRPLGEGGALTEEVYEEMILEPAPETKPAKKTGRFRSKKKAEKAERAVLKKEKKSKKKVDTSSTPFINQDKVAKRPLSSNTYKSSKEIVPTKDVVEGGPVTIIAKPKKDSHVGLIVTIILTIILGAVAGTVAFLLLPK